MIFDIGTGILAAVFTSWVFGVELSTALTLGGIIFALLPDSDVLWGAFLQKRGRWWERGIWGHREFTHYPLIHIVVAAVLYFLTGGVWAFLYVLCTFGHLLHDSIQDGWGIKWLWPLRAEPYELYIRRYGRNDWLVKKDWKLQGEYLGGRTHIDWLKKEYLGRVLKWEVAALIVAGLMLYLYVK